MANSILLKRSATAAKVPLTSDLVLGEIALNTYDGKLYLLKNNGSASVVEIGPVYTVAGRVGDITLSTSDVAESTNQYFTNTRARSAISVSGTGLSYNSGTGVITSNATSANTASTVVARDASGNFTAGTITANITGNVSGTAANVTGTVAITNGGTGATSAPAALTNLGALPLAGGTMTGNLTLSGDPTQALHAATKQYVDAIQQSLDVKDSVRVASTGSNIDFATGGLLTIDGITVASGDRVLLKDQTAGAENGIYVAASGAWSRSSDADTSAKVTPGMFTFVTDGTVNGDNGFVLVTNGPITLGSTALTFTQFSGAGQITAGNGLSKSGNTLSVLGTTNRISVSGSGVDISSSYVGQTSITTLGTITTGTWSGTTISVSKGGTGATTLTGVVYGNGTSAFTAATGAQIATALGSTNISGNAANVTGVVAVANGGTGANNATTARSNLSAAQSGANGDITTLTGLTTAFTIPAGSTAAGLLSSTNAGVAAAGSTQGTATALSSDINIVTSGTGGVVVPGAVSGKYAVIVNRTGSAINVYPAVGHAFDGLSANTPISLPASGFIEVFGSSSTQWHTTNQAITQAQFISGILAVANGGTGAATLTGYVKGNGTSAMTASATIPTADLSGTIDGGSF